MSLTHNTDVVGSGLNLLTQLFKGRPRIQALLTAWLTEFQEIEDALWSVFVERLLQNNPTGDLLDKIGLLVGQPRNGQSDADYTVFITARIKANRSNGRAEEIYTVLNLLLPSITVDITTTPPASILIRIFTFSTANIRLMFSEFILRMVGAGIGVALVYPPASFTSVIEFTSNYGGGTTVTTQRVGSVYGTYAGGVAADVVQG